MASFKLRGRISHIDTRGATPTIVVSLDEDKFPETIRKLKTHAYSGDRIPFDDTTFKVKANKVITEDQLDPYVGKEVSILVKARSYSFRSKLKQNAGETISGVNLNFEDIQIL